MKTIILLFLLGMSLASFSPAAVHYDRLTSFGTSTNDGRHPQGALVEGSGGVLYSTTVDGGANGSGTVFRVSKDGSGYEVLYHFGANATDGKSPASGLIKGSNGVLYGTTLYGGANASGTVYKLNQDGGGYQIMRNFGASNEDGVTPFSHLIEGSDGLLYGTTYEGGSNAVGTVFKLDKDGFGYTLLHTFNRILGDSQNPLGALMEGSDHSLYGTSARGGTEDAGSVFKLNKDGSGYKVLRSFSATGADSAGPTADLIEGSDGALYGTTGAGGTNGWGTVFKLNKDGTNYNVLILFGGTNGAYPNGLIRGIDGKPYGTTGAGGAGGEGTIFNFREDGSALTVLRDFAATGVEGQSPQAGLILGSDGAFYGTTFHGGDLGFGTVFRFFPPETPDVTSLTVVSNTVQVSFVGTSGFHYQVLRSPDLSHWTVLTTVTMPAAQSYTYVEPTPFPVTAFYRAAWVP